MRRYAHRKGSVCTADRDGCFAPASKTCRRDCPRCKWAKYSLPRVGDWRQSTAPPCTARALAPSSRSVNFRFFGKRRAQLNERDARITELRAAMHTFDHELDLVDRFGAKLLPGLEPNPGPIQCLIRADRSDFAKAVPNSVWPESRSMK